MTKIRLSNHTLNIETGRHNKIPKNKRFCPFCPNLVEDEMHFLLFCPTYTTNRVSLFQKLNIQQQIIHQEQLFRFLMINRNTVYITANFLKIAIHIRQFLVNKFRNDLSPPSTHPTHTWTTFTLNVKCLWLYVFVKL